MERKTLRWGLLATGMISNKLANALIGMNDTDNLLYACASRTQEKADAFAAKYGIPKAYGSYEAMLADPAVDIVYISTPSDSHGIWTRACLEAGKHVLCEKPFVTSSAEAKELFDLAAEKKLFLMEALWTYHLPLIKKTRELVAQGLIGDVYYVDAQYGFLAFGERRVRKFRSELAGGAILDIGIYNLAFAHQMLGCYLGEFDSTVRMTEFGTDWFSHIMAKYPCGADVAMTTSIGTNIGTPGSVYGTKGRIRFPNYQIAEHMTVTLNDGTEQQYDMPFDVNGFEYQVRECAACIAAGKLQSDVVPGEITVAHMAELENIRRQWGMKFSFEK